MRYLEIDLKSSISLVAFLASTVFLSYTSYRWIEKPIRTRKLLPTTGSLLTAMALSFAALSIWAIHVITSSGASYRYEDRIRSFLTARIDSRTGRCTAWALLKDGNPIVCELVSGKHAAPSHQRLLVWGDSHAGMWMPMLEELAQENSTALYLNKKNCRAVWLALDCNQENQKKMRSQIDQINPTDVVLAALWHDISNPELGTQLKELVKWLSEKDIKVWLVIDPPRDNSFDPLFAYTKNRMDPKFGTIPFEQYNQGFRLPELRLFETIQAQYKGVNIIDTADVYCKDLSCSSGHGNSVWYRDVTHLSNAGALAARHKFTPIFKKLP